MKNFFIFLIIILLSAVGIYFIGNSLLQSSLEAKLSNVPKNLKNYGISSQNPSIGKVSVNSSKSIVIKDLKTIFSFNNKSLFSNEEKFLFKIGKVSLLSKNYDFTEVDIVINDLNIKSVSDKKNITSFENIVVNEVSTTIKNQDKFKVIDTLVSEITNILSKQKTNLNLELDGAVLFNSGESANIIFENNKFVIENLDSLKKYKLNTEEIKLLRNLPLRAATIVNIKSNSAKYQSIHGSEANKDAVASIHYLMNVIAKFGEDSNILTDIFSSKDYLLYAKQYIKEGNDLTQLIAEQKDRFPVERKASYTIN